MGLSELRSSLGQAKDAHSRSVVWSTRFVKSVLIVGGACVAGVAQFVTWPVGKPPEPASIVGIAATVLVCIGGLFALSTEQDAAAAVRIAERSIEEVQEARSQFQELSAFFSSFDRLSETYRMCLTMRGALEQTGIGAAGDIDEKLRAMFELVARPIAIAAGFEQSDRWTIGIYKASPSAEIGKAELKCVAHKRAIPCEIHEARTWPEGVGIAGIAFSNQREIVIPDLRAEGVQAVFGPKGLVRPYDADRYVSMVAVPIMVAGRDKPWGVVNATSDRASHFSAESQPGFKTDEPVRALAAFVALAVAMDDAIDRARGTPPPMTTGPQRGAPKKPDFRDRIRSTQG